mgnify:FL=1
MYLVKAKININVAGTIYGPGEEFEINKEDLEKVKEYVEVLEEIKEEVMPYDKITAAKIKELLDEKGIEYDTEEKKELYELLYPGIEG